MRSENYIVFFIVYGFFIGLAFSIVNIGETFDILISTCFTIFMFYVFIHIVIINFIDIKKISGRIFNKHGHEKTNSNIINDLIIREKKIDIILEKFNGERKELKEDESEERCENAKRAA